MEQITGTKRNKIKKKKNPGITIINQNPTVV